MKWTGLFRTFLFFYARIMYLLVLFGIPSQDRGLRKSKQIQYMRGHFQYLNAVCRNREVGQNLLAILNLKII